MKQLRLLGSIYRIFIEIASKPTISTLIPNRKDLSSMLFPPSYYLNKRRESLAMKEMYGFADFVHSVGIKLSWPVGKTIRQGVKRPKHTAFSPEYGTFDIYWKTSEVTWVWIPDHQLTSCVTLEKLLLFSGPQRLSSPTFSGFRGSNLGDDIPVFAKSRLLADDSAATHYPNNYSSELPLPLSPIDATCHTMIDGKSNTFPLWEVCVATSLRYREDTFYPQTRNQGMLS